MLFSHWCGDAEVYALSNFKVLFSQANFVVIWLDNRMIQAATMRVYCIYGSVALLLIYMKIG